MAVIVARVEYKRSPYGATRLDEATVTIDAQVVWRRWYYREGIAWKWAKLRKAQFQRKEGQR